ncbi:MAG: esterase [Bdellovibrionales bacterium]|nr:esterase [Bdellovibrionales bacterium]
MFERNQLENVGGLDCLRWGATDSSAPKIVIMHGYGASAFDLFDLGQVLDPKQSFSWVFPQGHLDISQQMLMAGYAWFPIDAVAAQQAIEQNGGLKYAHLRPAGIDEAVDRCMKFLKAIDFNPAQDLLGGFSQGSMMCIELQRKLPGPLKKLLIFSGSIVDKQGLEPCRSQFEGAEVFQSHGTFDEVLPMSGAEVLRDSLLEMGSNVRFEEFRGGHEIPMQVLQSCRSFLGS